VSPTTRGISSSQILDAEEGRFGPHLVTNPDRMEATLGEPAVLITDRKIWSLADLLPILEKPHQQVT
jgi:chaperonin GroEL